MKLDCFNEVERITKKLVSIKSVNKDPNSETNIANYIYGYLFGLDYFKDHSDQVIKVKTKDDVVDRHSVVAYIKGNSNKTIILTGHIDTVDTKDYGSIEDYAYMPDELPNKLKQLFNLPQEVLSDIDSDNYMFGRGALDMKSGVASHLYLMKYFANHLEELNGNLVFVAECDEEDGSLGIISCLDVLDELKQKENFEYVACLNTDFHTPTNKEDSPIVYFGTVGKLLPCFTVFGKEAHVGNAFDAFDPNLLLSEITKRMSLNMDLTDNTSMHTTVPPISLKQTDLKESYTVQTAISAFAYYNYLIYNSSPKEVMEKCKKIATESFDEIIELLNSQYKVYCEKNYCDYGTLPWTSKVYSYTEWCKMLSSQNPNFDYEMRVFAEKLHDENPNMDLRMFGYEMVKKSYEYYGSKDPVVVIFYGTMFYSPIECKDETLMDAVNKAVDTVNNDSDYKTKTDMFYPYISDISFMATNYSREVIDDMLANCPQHRIKYVYPIDKITNINVPVVNIGVYGKDGHMYTERVNKEYSFKNVPNITYETIKELLK